MANLRYDNQNACENQIYPLLQYITRSKFENDWRSNPHSHPFTEIVFVVSGKGTVLIETENFPVSEGEIVVIPPNKSHTELSSDTSALENYYIGVKNFDMGISKRSEKLPEESVGSKLELGTQCKKIEQIFYDIFIEMKLKHTGYEMMVQSLLLELTVFLTRSSEWKPFFTETKAMNRKVAIIKDFIENHYADDITLDKLAEENYISKYYLVHEFNKHLGTTPIAYQQKCRINEAKNMLTSTELRIVDIAFEVGYSSASHFSQRFKTEEKCSPFQYRKRSAEKTNN